MKTILVFFGVVVLFTNTWSESVTNNLNLNSGLIYGHGAIFPDDSGLKFTSSGVRDLTVSVGQLSGVDPETGEAIGNFANLVPIVAQSVETAGDIIVGGELILKDGTRLTDVLLSCLDGKISTKSTHSKGTTSVSAYGVAISSLLVQSDLMVNGVTTVNTLQTDGSSATGLRSIAEGRETLASGDDSHAAGANAKAVNELTYVWSDGTDIESTTNKQYTVYAENGIRLLGGEIEGDGSGLINLSAENIVGTIPMANLPAGIGSGGRATNVIWGAIGGALSNQSDLTSVLAAKADSSDLAALETEIVAVESSVNTHLAQTDNPHQVTASQVGAYTTSETDDAISNAVAGISFDPVDPLNVTNLTVYSLTTIDQMQSSDSLATGDSSYAIGSSATAANDNAYVWSDGTAVGSTTNKQYTVYAENGIRLLGGEIEGDGSGLINLSAENIVGTIPMANLPTGIAGGSATNVMWGTINGTLTDQTDLASAFAAKADSSDLAALETEIVAVESSVNTHLAQTDNPHQVTASQVGAYTTSETDDAISNAVAGISFDPVDPLNVTNLTVYSLATIDQMQSSDSLATGDSSYAIGSSATAANDNAYVWSDGTAVESTTNKQYTVYAENGIRLLGGEIEGDGGGLTNINVTNLVGVIPSENLPESSGGSATSAVWGSIEGTLSNQSDLTSALDAKADSADLVVLELTLNDHTASANNPHQVTASQVGAYTIFEADLAVSTAITSLNAASTNGFSMGGDIDMNDHRIVNLADPVDDKDAVSKSYFENALLSIGPFGDLSMGSYTNAP